MVWWCKMQAIEYEDNLRPSSMELFWLARREYTPELLQIWTLTKKTYVNNKREVCDAARITADANFLTNVARIQTPCCSCAYQEHNLRTDENRSNNQAVPGTDAPRHRPCKKLIKVRHSPITNQNLWEIVLNGITLRRHVPLSRHQHIS